MTLAEQIPGIGEHGQEQRGDWTVFWAEAGRPLFDHKERMAVMAAQGIPAEDWHLEEPRPINKLDGGRSRTWWQARPMQPGMPWRFHPDKETKP